MSRSIYIGITLDIEYQSTYAREPWYALRENYCTAIQNAGGTPVCLPHDVDQIDAYLDLVDGLVISGGMYDIKPELYGETDIKGGLVTKEGRTEFERRLVLGALQRDLPMIGICGGMQLIAVAHGAKLIQDIPTGVKAPLEHMQPEPHDVASHSVSFTPGTCISRLFGAGRVEVNSVHHQSVKDIPPEILVSAVSADRVIEAIEIPGQSFCLGFQWHPEYQINEGEGRVFRALIEAAADYAERAAMGCQSAVI
ncbi:gamma-glutamyl-gamma-aminobutyrate hydrolase family protein [Marinobacterium arenosum]|uniref:gamma-glutamyl-gamma-aminobutyrate hydrolase family protein n=1 Tax=Marinobacterium arenosum TaxID=2862496 RepID=UPI001C981550|nr:gamma-glutamyl-gamma-aminobutyrate hydrolase family protein [Marinobacterium arenosum]MBY4674995.1 gamma-glutamyl-gamma-aminobutyrate hydrolase family protein [Marinobacterium arenosum]